MIRNAQGGRVFGSGATISGNKIIVSYPISFSVRPVAFVMPTGDGNAGGPQSAEVSVGTDGDSYTKVQYYLYRNGVLATSVWTYWVAVGH